MTELESLQNAANNVNLTVIEKFTTDKRNTVKKFLLVDSQKNTISPVLDYENLNHFILGFIKASNIYKRL